MAFAIGVIVFIVGITISVALHELGHMLPAKLFGVKVPQYMIGFGPTLWSRKRGDTEYGVKAFPLGGYTRLMGMVPPADEVKPLRVRGPIRRLIEDTRESNVQEISEGEEHRSFYRLVWWKRVIVMVGGIAANFILAVLIFTGIGVFYGASTATPGVAIVLDCVLPYGVERECTDADPDTAAELAGFEAGDRILAVDEVAVDEWAPVVEYVKAHPGEAIGFTVLRDGEEITLTATPTLENRPVYGDDGEYLLDRSGEVVTTQVGYLGLYPTSEIVPQGIGYGSALTVDYLGDVADAIVHLPGHLVNATQAILGFEERDPNGIMSIWGAGRAAGDTAAYEDPNVGLGDRVAGEFFILAFINLALFAFNLLPLPPLDGGHVVGALWEGVKNGWARARKLPKPAPVDLARMMPLTYVMVVLLVLMGALFVYADIVVPVQID